MNHTTIGLCGNAGRQMDGGMKATPIQGYRGYRMSKCERGKAPPQQKNKIIYFFTSPPYTPPTMKFI